MLSRCARSGVRRPAPAAPTRAREARLLLDNAREATARRARRTGRRGDVHPERHRTPCTSACWAWCYGARLRRRGCRSRTPPSSTRPCGTPHEWGARGDEVRRGRRRACRPRPRSAPADVTDTEARGRRPAELPTTRSARCSRSAGSTYAPDAPALHRRLRIDGPARTALRLGGSRGVGAQVGRPGRGRACCWCAPGARWRNPFPGDDRIDERSTGFENIPAVLAAAAALQAVVAEREEVNVRVTMSSSTSYAHRVAAEVSGRRGRRRSRCDRLPHLVTFSCLYVDGEALVHRARPPRLRHRERLGVHRVDPHAQPRPGGDGRADPRQRPALPAARRHPRGRATPSATSLPVGRRPRSASRVGL